MQELNSIYSDGIYDTIHGMETIKAYNMQGMQIQKLRKVLYKILEETKKYDVNIAVTLACILAVTYIPMVITFIFGAYLVNIGEIEVSLLFGYSQLIGPISSPIINLFSSTTAMKNACQSMKRLDTVMNMEEERKGGCKLVPEGKMAVVFHKVSFGYDINKKIFRKLSFNIKRGQCIGIVGNSGGGKTTIVKLICGLYEIDEGQIRIFGSDIKDLDIDCWRKNIAYISQNAYILPGTIAENVRCGNNNITDEEVKIALSQAGLKEYVDNLPNGIHTVLHEGGMNLSGGQRQKIALARIFLHKALFYIFDEPTASMDINSEKEVITKVHELIRQNDAAGIIISHNFEIIKKCDEVWFVKNGILRETGTFEELIRQKGFFYNQFYMQGTKI